jgi:hypothetical protein
LRAQIHRSSPRRHFPAAADAIGECDGSATSSTTIAVKLLRLHAFDRGLHLDAG